jgi:hypothetical protein
MYQTVEQLYAPAAAAASLTLPAKGTDVVTFKVNPSKDNGKVASAYAYSDHMQKLYVVVSMPLSPPPPPTNKTVTGFRSHSQTVQ